MVEPLPLLVVWCVCVGDKYTTDDVLILRSMVARHCQRPFRFICLSDRQRPGVFCYIPQKILPGWWSKLLVFEAGQSVYSQTQHLYFDLDVVITGSIDALASDVLSMPANWAQSGHGGCQSSVMAWSRDYGWLADAFDVALLSEPANGNYGYYGPDRLWGDQEFITSKLGDPGGIDVSANGDSGKRYVAGPDTGVVKMTGIYSYKYHCRDRGGPPNDARVVCFHGEPKPNDVSEQWVIDARRHTC